MVVYGSSDFDRKQMARWLAVWRRKMKEERASAGLPELVAFADKLEKATIDTIESGIMTKDLYLITTKDKSTCTKVNFLDFIKAIRKNLEAML